jgi:hypothetical protein
MQFSDVEDVVKHYLRASDDLSDTGKREIERKYKLNQDKIRELDMSLPRLKQQIRDFFELSNKVKSVFLQIDDFYLLTRPDQPLVMDYIHRLLARLAHSRREWMAASRSALAIGLVI